MALTLTDLQTEVIKNNAVDKYEVRSKNYGFFDTGLKNQGNLIDKNVAGSKRSLEQVIKVPVLKKGHVGSNGGRVIGTIPTALGTSAMVTLATHTVQRHFSIQPAENFGNYIDYVKEFNKAMRELQLQLLSDIDTYIQTQVHAARSLADKSSAYPFAAGVYTIPNTDYQKLLYKISPIYRSNDYTDENLTLIANPMYEAEINELLEHSQQNDQNKTLRLANKNIAFSNAITPTGTHAIYSTTNSGFEIQNFNEPDAILKTKKSEAEYKMEFILPLLGMKFGLYTQKSYVANSQGTASTLMESFSFATDIVVVTPYLSTPATDPAPTALFQLT